MPQQVEDCDENFVKECFIEYKPFAFNETVEICNETPVRSDCGQEGQYCIYIVITRIMVYKGMVYKGKYWIFEKNKGVPVSYYLENLR